MMDPVASAAAGIFLIAWVAAMFSGVALYVVGAISDRAAIENAGCRTVIVALVALIGFFLALVIGTSLR